jgi:hypothetical protein
MPVRKPMPLWKKILVIFFLIVCGFGLYDTFFPSKKSVNLDTLFNPQTVTPAPKSDPTVVPPSPTIITSPSPIISPSQTASASPTSSVMEKQ